MAQLILHTAFVDDQTNKKTKKKIWIKGNLNLVKVSFLQLFY